MSYAKISNFKFQISNSRGQTLIETVIALAVVLILVSALLSLSITSVRSATLSRNKNAASQLAYRESELIRNVRDSSYMFDWAQITSRFGVANCSAPPLTNHCKVDYVSGLLTFVSDDKLDSTLVSGTTFTIYFNGSIGASAMNYTVYVTWTDSLGPHAESISSILTPWK